MEDNRWLIGIKVVGVAVAVVGVPSGIGFFVDKLQVPISRVTIGVGETGVDLPAGRYVVSYWGLFLVATLATVALVLAAWIWLGLKDARTRRAEARARAAESEEKRSLNDRAAAEARAQTARDQLLATQASFETRTAYDQVCRAIRRVVFNSYNPVDSSTEPAPHLTFLKIDCTFDIDASGDARVTQDYEVEFGPNGARFWTLRLDADQYAEPMETLRSIEFESIALEAGHEVVALPIDNEGVSRSVALFFLPEPQPFEKRAFRTVFNWRKWFGELPATGLTDWRWSYKSLQSERNAEVTFRFRFAADAGSITAENVHYKIEGETLELSTEHAGAAWIYRSAQHPAGRLNWVLRFRKSCLPAPAAAAAGSSQN